MSDERDRGDKGVTRRDFFRLAGAAGFGALAGNAAAATGADRAPAAAAPDTMPTRNLGRTGHRVGLFSLGGQAAIEKPNNAATAVPLIERALDLGVNYLDTSARYGGVEERWSERYVGQVMRRRRGAAFLATKTHDRTRDGSLRLLERSLELLNTDHLDLWQLHNLTRMEELERIFARGGAIEALQQAREQKLVRFLGVTGHADPAVLIEAVRRFEFDTLLLALNAADPHHLSFAAELLPLAVERRMGIIGMKVPARGRLLSTWTPPRAQPAERGRAITPGRLTMREAMGYVLSLPVSTVIVGCDSIAQLEENVAIARDFTPISDAARAALTARAEPVARQSLFFRDWS